MKPDVGAEIMEERLTWALDMVKRVFNDLKLSNFELAQLAERVGNTLYVRKEIMSASRKQ